MQLFKSLSKEDKSSYFYLSLLLVSVYFLAIFGETLSEAIAIKRLGTSIIPKLFKINAISLFFGTIFLYSFIEKFHRWIVLKGFAISFGILIFITSILLHFTDSAIIPIFLYSLAYISKLILFTLIWIIANDICDTRTSKHIFPLIAATGLAGGVLVVFLSQTFIRVVNVEIMILLLPFMFYLPYKSVELIREKYSYKLMVGAKKLNSTEELGLLSIIKRHSVLTMAGVYLILFFLIINVDYLYIKSLAFKFFNKQDGHIDIAAFVSFKLNIYLITTAIIITFQYLYTTDLSKRFGVTNSLIILPIVFFLGFIIIFGFRVEGVKVYENKVAFSFILIFYILRVILFESIFSPNYQIYFSALAKSFRGRGKILLEGVIKPIAIIFASLFLVFWEDNTPSFYAFLTISASVLLVLTFLLKKQYNQDLIYEFDKGKKKDLVKIVRQEMSAKNKDKILSLIGSVFSSQDYDLKQFAIKYLEAIASDKAFEVLRRTFFEEKEGIKVYIASSLATFDGIEARGFIRQLLSDRNPSIQVSVLNSIRRNNSFIEKTFDIKQFIVSEDIYIFCEAAKILSKSQDKSNIILIENRIHTVMNYNDISEKKVVLDLISYLKLDKFFNSITKYLKSSDYELWVSAVDAAVQFSNQKSFSALLNILADNPDRNKENYIIFKMANMEALFIKDLEERIITRYSKRTIFSYIRLLKVLAENYKLNTGKPYYINETVKNKLMYLAQNELRDIYLDIYRYYDIRIGLPFIAEKVDLLKMAIRDKRKRFASIVLDIMALLDSSGTLFSITDIFVNLKERDKANIIELIELFGKKDIALKVTPILEDVEELKLVSIGKDTWAYKREDYNTALNYFIYGENIWLKQISEFILWTEKKRTI